MVDSGMDAREAYDAVPALQGRGQKCLQNLRKRARAERAKQETAAPTTPAAKPSARKPAAKPARRSRRSLLPKGKRLRSDQVDALAVASVDKRAKRTAAHKEASAALAAAREEAGGRTPNGKAQEIVERVPISVDIGSLIVTTYIYAL